WWRHVAAGPGLIDFALLTNNTTIAVAAAADRGLMMNGPVPGGRIRPDGISLAWETAWPPSPDLPFLCGDVTDRAYRVPDADFWGHSNGARGIAEVIVAVTDPVASTGRYAALLGITPHAAPAEVRIPLGESEIVLRGPDSGDPTVIDRLTRRGEGICAITLRGLHFPDLAASLGATIMAAR
ncbi:MAG: VOC family protein, partial [Chloroflexus sp.]